MLIPPVFLVTEINGRGEEPALRLQFFDSRLAQAVQERAVQRGSTTRARIP
jgi:hypothetical protein